MASVRAKFPRLGLRGKFLVFFLALDLVVVGLLVFTVDREVRRRLGDEIREKLAGTAAYILDDADENMLGTLNSLQRLAADPALEDPALEDPARGLIAQYEAFGGKRASVSKLYLLGADRQVLRKGGAGPAFDFGAVGWWEALAKGYFQISTVGTNAEALVVMAVPRMRGAVFRGALVGIFSLDMLRQLTESQGRFSAALLTSSSRIIFGDVPWDLVNRVAVADIAPRHAAIFEVGDRFYAVYATYRVPSLDWNIVISIPRVTVMKPVRDLEVQMLLVGLGATLLVGLFVFIGMRIVVLPIRKLRDSMNEIILHGNLSGRADIRSRDEIGELAETFNQMVGEIQSQRVNAVSSAKMAALGEMAGELAHEINTPLATVIFSASQLRDIVVAPGDLNVAALNKISQRIEDTTMKIAAIVKGLRVLSRDGSHDDFVEADLQEIVRDALSICQSAFAQHGVQLTVSAIPSGIRIKCRPTQISQTVLNLLNNARDAIQPLPEKWVKLEVTSESDRVCISVTDSGKGISPEIQAKLFQPFFTTKGVGKGTGLGLSISRQIIADHGGSLIIDRNCPNTRFVMTIPALVSAGTADRSRSEAQVNPFPAKSPAS